MEDMIKIHEDDMVAVALKPLEKGKQVFISGQTIVLQDDIMQGHKFALRKIKKGEQVIKYGSSIGIAKEDIPLGAWVHTHNMKTGLSGTQDMTYHKKEPFAGTETAPAAEKIANTFFSGYQRENGKVGVRNEIWIIPTVGCVNNVAQAIEKRAKKYVKGTVEEVVSFPHPYGCSQIGEDQEHTRKILADLVNHPNAGGVLVLGLGCENSNIEQLKKYIGDYHPKRVKFLVAQECEDEVETALDLVSELAEYAAGFERVPIPASELVIGLKCGGSDGLSGITANPVVGRLSDLLIKEGGTTILTEVPEMFGAESLLLERCADEALFQKTVALINDFKNYFTSHHQVIYENPSPGNKLGGITTLEDKSLGCTQKSGSAPVRGVLSYGDTIQEKGLNLLSAPGNDLVAATALAAAGAHIILFTTGRGTPFASPVPTVKIASNTKLAQKKNNWIDFDCGVLVEGRSLEKTAAELFSYVMAVASGKKVKAEEAGFHDMAIFKQGVTL